MKAYWARRRGNGGVALRKGKVVDGKGLSPAKFKKFLVKGPIAAGGNGEDE